MKKSLIVSLSSVLVAIGFIALVSWPVTYATNANTDCLHKATVEDIIMADYRSVTVVATSGVVYILNQPRELTDGKEICINKRQR